ncbi:hypothetical protein EDD16DRAFT_1714761 [Pisolithus croceorrhizus]|nr:hypothetical protein EDD16DRAFT_1714761 [Pisolithus croceorrhizus]
MTPPHPPPQLHHPPPIAPYPMHPAAPLAHGFPPPLPFAVQPGMEEMHRQYFEYPPPPHPHLLPAADIHPPQVDYAAALQQNFERDHAEHRQRHRRRQRGAQIHDDEERGQLHDLQLLQVQQQLLQQQHQQRQREQQIHLQEEAHHAQHQRELQQQHHLSQALNEFGRLSAEHYAEDEERHHLRAAEQNPGANDLAFPIPPPAGPPGAETGPLPTPPPGPPGADPGPPPLLPLDPLVQTLALAPLPPWTSSPSSPWTPWCRPSPSSWPTQSTATMSSSTWQQAIC